MLTSRMTNTGAHETLQRFWATLNTTSSSPSSGKQKRRAATAISGWRTISLTRVRWLRSAQERDESLTQSTSPARGMARIAAWHSHIVPYHLKCCFSHEEEVYPFLYSCEAHFFKVLLSRMILIRCKRLRKDV